jgi:hypothetical protein
MGKFMHFSVGGVASSYEVFSLAAARDQTQLVNAEITPITPVHGAPTDFTQQRTIPQTLQVKSMQVIDSSGGSHNSWGIGFVQSLGSTTGGAFNSGSQTVNLVYSNGLSSGSDNETAAAALLDSAHIKAANSAVMCITDGTRTAQVLIGLAGGNDANNAPNVSLKVTAC